jgi:hypothetical protein
MRARMRSGFQGHKSQVAGFPWVSLEHPVERVFKEYLLGT